MALGIAVVIASTLGIIRGINKKNKPLLIVSVLAMVLTISVWVYFYNNPY